VSELDAPLVLASASPRRREILQRLGIPFRVAPSRADETRRPGEAPDAYVRRAARAKAAEVAGRFRGEAPAPFVLAADTIVVLEGDVLGKPGDDHDAWAMIARLEGRAHFVTTAVALGRAGAGVLGDVAVTTRVIFRELSGSEIDGYVASGEGRDKAGAYAIQGLGAGLVQEIAGSYENVVGLPAVETLRLLREQGALLSWP
jgi:septum formation protein